MKTEELTGTQGLIGGIFFTLILLFSIGFIQIPTNSIEVGTKYAEKNNVKDIVICGYKFDDDETAKESCEETVKSKYYFGGYKCGDDCSEHEAGYDWARNKGISNEKDCAGKTPTFIDGCKVFVEENDYAN